MPPKAAASKGKAAPAHASYQDMITDAIINLKDHKGSGRTSLKKYIKANNKISAPDATFDSLFNRALRAGVAKGVFSQPRGTSGGTKLAKPAPKTEKKEKKPAAAKPKVAAAKPKAAATKKTTVTKAKAAPKASVAKKAAPKKPAAKPKAAAKAAPKAKKAAAPKAAPAIIDKPTVLSKTKSGRVTKTAPKLAAKKAAPKKAAPKKAAKKAT